MFVLLVAGLFGAIFAFGVLFPFGLVLAIVGAIASGAVCIGLAGAWLALTNRDDEEREKYSDGPGGSDDEPRSGWRSGGLKAKKRNPPKQAFR